MTSELNPAKKRSIGSQILSGIIAAVVLLGGAMFFVSLFAGDGKPKVPTYTDAGAFMDAQYAVKSVLKAPSTAKFASSLDDATIEESDGNTFKVSSYVDAQNAFGAMLRSHWTVLLKYDGGYDPVVYQVILDGKELYRKPGQ